MRATQEQESSALLVVGRQATQPRATIFYHLLDLVRIFSINQMLTQRMKNEIALEYKNLSSDELSYVRCDLAFNALTLFGPAALISILAKTINFMVERRKKSFPSAESYFFALFSGSKGLILLKILEPMIKKISGSDELSPGAFATVASIGIVLVAALFVKLTFPDNDNGYRLLFHYADCSGPVYRNPSAGQRIMNAMGGISYSLPLYILFWAFKRERYDGSVAATPSELVILGSSTIACGVLGAITTTDFPKLFHILAMFSRFIYGATAAAVIFAGCEYFKTEDVNTAQTQSLYSNLYIVGWVLFALVMGVQSAFTTQFQFESTYHSNKYYCDLLLEKYRNLRNCIFGTPAPLNDEQHDERPRYSLIADAGDNSAQVFDETQVEMSSTRH